jgi:multidrug efflux system membrane fusion protein
VPKQQEDSQRALVAQLVAQVKADQAAIDNARALLGYTTIVSPIDGRTGIRQVDQGNLLHSTDANGIVAITQLRPISVIFTLPQQTLVRINSAAARGTLAVDALTEDNLGVRDRGVLNVVDNQVDQTTGTIRLKASFPNADLQLWPGQFVNVRLRIDTLRHVLTVPTAAVQQGPNGAFVYIVGAEDKVAVRSVTIGDQRDAETAITRGLEPGLRVVTTGFARLSDGARVRVSAQEEDAAAEHKGHERLRAVH